MPLYEFFFNELGIFDLVINKLHLVRCGLYNIKTICILFLQLKYKKKVDLSGWNGI